MILEVVRVTVAPEDAQAYIDAFARARRFLAASPHCLGFTINRCLEHPEQFLLFIEWHDVSGHLAFRATDGYAGYRACVDPFVRAVEVLHYERATFSAEPAGGASPPTLHEAP